MRPAECHPERRHSAKGLCLECYTRDVAIPRSRAHYAANKERHAAKAAEWKAAHPEKVREYKAAHNRSARGIANQAAWRKSNPDAVKRIERRCRLKTRYGISDADYDAMLLAQGGACKVCKKTPASGQRRLNVDHCHTTLRVRGLLCNICNVLMGLVDADPEYLGRLGEYAKCP